jgi:hypothetical protein
VFYPFALFVLPSTAMTLPYISLSLDVEMLGEDLLLSYLVCVVENYKQ